MEQQEVTTAEENLPVCEEPLACEDSDDITLPEALLSPLLATEETEEPVEFLEVRHEQSARGGISFEIIIAEATAVPQTSVRLSQSGKQRSAEEIQQKLSFAEERRCSHIDGIRAKAAKFIQKECGDGFSYYLRNLQKPRYDIIIAQRDTEMEFTNVWMETYKKEQVCDKLNNSFTEYDASKFDQKVNVPSLKNVYASGNAAGELSFSQYTSDTVEEKSCEPEAEVVNSGKTVGIGSSIKCQEDVLEDGAVRDLY